MTRPPSHSERRADRFNPFRYVLSTTHLHEFKSADKAQAPIMSLYLPDQKLGSHSSEGGSSNKFILKGRQTGSMHRGHTWVFRAESHDTMMAWYDDIKALTENSPEERSQFVRSHSRSLSRSSRRSVSSDGIMDEDDEDEEPFSANSQIDVNPGPKQDAAPRRSQPGGRFPSDIQVNAQRGLQAPHSPSSVSSGVQEQQQTGPQAIAAAAALPGTDLPAENYHQGNDQDGYIGYGDTSQTSINDVPSSAVIADQEAQYDGVNPYTSEPLQQQQQQQQQFPPQSQQQEQAIFYNPTILGANHQDTQSYADGGSSKREIPQQMAQPTAYETVAAGNPGTMSAANAEAQMNGHGSVGGGNVSVLAAGFPVSEAAQQVRTQPQPTGPETPVSPSDVSTVETGSSARRPTSNTMRTDSVQTISNLHIPGGYPRGSISK